MKDHRPQKIDGKMCVWLQDLGWQSAKLGQELRVGDILAYDYGRIGEITKLVKETSKTVLFVISCNGKLYRQRFHKAHWVPIA